MPTCPNGHQSVSDDWCEVCGHRMAGAGAPTGAVPPPPPPPPPAYGYPGPGGPGQPPAGPPTGAPGGPGAYGGPDGPGGYGGPDGPGTPGGYGGPGGPGGYGAPSAPGGFGPGGDPNATAQAELCPQCRTPREHMAPFCEECRWNFLTNTATSYTPVAPQNIPSPQRQQGPPPGLNLPPGFQSTPPPPQGQQPGPQGQPGQQQPQDPFGYQGSRPSQVNRPAEPLGGDATHHQAPPQRPPAQQPPGPAGQGDPFGPPGQQPPAPPAYLQTPSAPPAAPVQAPAPPAPPQPRADDDWVLSPPSQHQAPPQPPQHQGPPPHMAPPPPHQGQYEAPQHQAPPPPPQHQAPPQQQFQPPRQPLSWTAVIGPDREYFMAMMQRSGPEAGGLNLPAYSPDKHLPLQGNQISIGRRRHSTGESPDIDLSVPPEDPGVSHQHAVLVQQPDGSWAVVDQNSTNGTTINGGEEPIQPYVPIQLQDGDRVHVGAWTTITIRVG
ncbi:FHA domain-containing protein [Streptomyces sp. NBC_00250]|uniref:FHA domain-containing protein n=1 Tax=Streptomyces sp. NBC_00250 TaxID=2903641 RepID=UPI002E2940A0|nr:FHA domain-containing protein [Streptomyces sp. NBC_00250]